MCNYNETHDIRQDLRVVHNCSNTTKEQMRAGIYNWKHLRLIMLRTSVGSWSQNSSKHRMLSSSRLTLTTRWRGSLLTTTSNINGIRQVSSILEPTKDEKEKAHIRNCLDENLKQIVTIYQCLLKILEFKRMRYNFGVPKRIEWNVHKKIFKQNLHLFFLPAL